MATHNIGRVLPIFWGEYNNTIKYTKLDVVYYNGSSYVANGDVQGVKPDSDITKWTPVAMAGRDITKISQLQNDLGYLLPRDIIDNLDSTDVTKPLSANQGNQIKINMQNMLRISENLSTRLTATQKDVTTLTTNLATTDSNVSEIDNKVLIVDNKVKQIEKELAGGVDANANKQAVYVAVDEILPNFNSATNTIDFGDHAEFYCGKELIVFKERFPDAEYRNLQLIGGVDGTYNIKLDIKNMKIIVGIAEKITADEFILGTYSVIQSKITNINFNFPFEINTKYQTKEIWTFTMADGTTQTKEIFIYK